MNINVLIIVCLYYWSTFQDCFLLIIQFNSVTVVCCYIRIYQLILHSFSTRHSALGHLELLHVLLPSLPDIIRSLFHEQYFQLPLLFEFQRLFCNSQAYSYNLYEDN